MTAMTPGLTAWLSTKGEGHLGGQAEDRLAGQAEDHLGGQAEVHLDGQAEDPLDSQAEVHHRRDTIICSDFSLSGK